MEDQDPPRRPAPRRRPVCRRRRAHGAHRADPNLPGMDCSGPHSPSGRRPSLGDHGRRPPRSPSRPAAAEEQECFDGPPSDAGLIEWFRAGHAALVQTLEGAPADLACWSFLSAPRRWLSGRAGRHTKPPSIAPTWNAPPAQITPYPPDFAADGIDELLLGFASRPGGRRRSRNAQDPVAAGHGYGSRLAGPHRSGRHTRFAWRFRPPTARSVPAPPICISCCGIAVRTRVSRCMATPVCSISGARRAHPLELTRL